VVNFTTRQLYSRENLSIHWKEDLVGSKAYMDVFEKKIIFRPTEIQNPDHPARSLVAAPTKLVEVM